MRRILLFGFLVIFLNNAALANNNLFLPGDAFFPVQLTAEDLREMQTGDAKEKVFRYSNFGGYSGAFCGYAGYSRAQFEGVDRTFIANLATAYGNIRQYQRKELVEVVENGKTKQVETNGMRILFYPQNFDFTRFKLGLQYNEKWVEETMKFGHDRAQIRLCELIDDKDAVMQSWRDATLVGTLDVVLPKVELTPEPVEEFIQIKGPVKAIVLQYSLKEYLHAGDNIRTMYVVDSAAIQQFEWREYQWKHVEAEK